MRYYSGTTIGIQGFLIVLISVITSVTFANSFFFSLICELVSRSGDFDTNYISLILGVVLAAVGVIQVLLAKKSGFGFFMVVVSIFFAPSILETTDINWAGLFGWQFELEAGLPAGIVLLFLSLVIISQIIITLVMRFDTTAEMNQIRGFSRDEVRTTYFRQVAWCLGIVFSILVIMAGIFLAVESISSVLVTSFPDVKIDVLFAGAGCVIVLVIVIYLAIISGHLSEKNVGHLQSAGANAGEGSVGIIEETVTGYKGDNPWACPRCGSDLVRQYRVSGGDDSNSYSWESQCMKCNTVWRWDEYEISETTK